MNTVRLYLIRVEGNGGVTERLEQNKPYGCRVCDGGHGTMGVEKADFDR